MMSEPLIELQDLTFAYPGAPHPVFQGLNYQLLPGKHVGLIGPNGCGKTTLLHLIMGLLRPQAGRIVIFGQEVKKEKDFVEVRQKVGLLFQNADDQLFCPTVLEDVAFGPLNQGKKPAAAIRIARETMERLGLQGFENRVTYKLSGGEKKLVSLWPPFWPCSPGCSSWMNPPPAWMRKPRSVSSIFSGIWRSRSWSCRMKMSSWRIP
jgi:cobalt/nickel transport system ATP-binding protein